MISLSNYFGVAAELAIVTFAVLAVGGLIVAGLRQPVERVRAIQATLLAVVAAVGLRQAAVLPAIPWAWVTPSPSRSDSPSNNERTGVNRVDARFSATGEAPSTAPPTKAAVNWQANSAAGPAAASSRWQLVDFWEIFRALCVAAAIGGGAWQLVRWGVGRRRLSRLVGRASLVDNEAVRTWAAHAGADRRGVRILVSSEVDAPLTFGSWRPVIVLPADLLASGSKSALKSCLEHEWAHIVHGHARAWTLVRLTAPLAWFQPVFWRLARELRVAQDQLADQVATGASADRVGYAELLASFSRRRQTMWTCPALSMADRPSHLRRRIEVLLADHLSVRLRARPAVTASIVGVLAITACLVSALGGRSDAAEDQDPAKAQKAQAPAAEGALTFSGIIADAKTKLPVAGAEVTVRRSATAGPNRKILEESHHVTNAVGFYEFVIPPEQVAEKRLYVELDVKHAGHVPRKGFGYSLSMIRKNLKLGERPFFSWVELWPSESVTGRVIDPDGRPLAGVKVRAFTSAAKDDWNSSMWPLVETDGDGRFTIDSVPGGPCIVWIVPEDFAPRQLVLEDKRGDQGEIRVEPGVRLRGRVTDAEGKAVKGVWVNLEDETAGQEIKIPVATSVVRSDKTDDDGRFEMGPLAKGPASLRIDESPRETKYEDVRRSSTPVEEVFVVQNIDLATHDMTKELSVKALPSVEFRGRFVDSKGQPTTGWQISIAGQVDEQWCFVQLEPTAEGRFAGRLPLRMERGELNAISNEHHSLRIRLKPGDELKSGRQFNLSGVDADLNEVEIVKYVSPIVQIAVVDEAGLAVEDVQIAGLYDNGDPTVTPVGGSPTNMFLERQGDGRFRTSQMLPDVKTTFTAKAKGYEDASETVSLGEGEERQITLRLSKSKKQDGDNKVAAAASGGLSGVWQLIRNPPKK